MNLGSRMLILLAGAVVLAIGCKGSEGGTAEAPKPPAETVAFAQVQPILSAKCIGCHGAANPKAGVNLTTFAGVSKIVKAGDPKESELVQVMHGGEGHKRMPPMGEPVPDAQIKIVEDWIQAGAKES